ncbi:Argininosuccinate lyase [Variovorax sp. PBS-H4]|uniref:Bug family tripartite tricarboxylate transporter substrate binding protein n=1 Tax=Variovorax sp. PBS-H4 TaxID=434008 RepID=UPI00131617C7|nr:tripartite tricarboxylate transporter substrate binding protein [Variovorax sp. PBS-H4]VTU31683.1 Argininosuccinate lyase [Variovorax sp. PBS-H4]
MNEPALSVFRRSGLVATAVLLVLSAVPAAAQSSAGRAARIVVGSAAGASSDAVARLLADSFTHSLGRPFIVDNKPGASGNIAAELVAKSPPDGNNLLLIYNAHPAVGALFPHLPFDPVKDFRSVGLIGTTPYVLVATPTLPGRNLGEALARARAAGTPLSFGSTGAGSPQHLTMERLKKESGIDITMVHYKGGALASNDVIAGHVNITLATPSLAMPQLKAGRLKALAVTADERLPELPDVPTVTEAGFHGFVSVGWFALLLPAATPDAVVQRYNEALDQALRTSPVKERLLAQGITPTPGAPAVLDRQMQGDAQMWTRLIKELNIKPE